MSFSVMKKKKLKIFNFKKVYKSEEHLVITSKFGENSFSINVKIYLICITRVKIFHFQNIKNFSIWIRFCECRILWFKNTLTFANQTFCDYC